MPTMRMINYIASMLVIFAAVNEVASSCDQLYTSEHDTLSIRVPTNYEYFRSADQCWYINSPGDKKVSVYSVSTIYLTSYDDDLCESFIEIRCGDEDGNRIGMYCHGEIINRVWSSSSQITIRYVSTSSSSGLHPIYIYYEPVPLDLPYGQSCLKVNDTRGERDKPSGVLVAGVSLAVLVLGFLLVMFVFFLIQRKEQSRMKAHLQAEEASASAAEATALQNETKPKKKKKPVEP